MNTNTRLPSLDGWRALSIILVLGGHSVSAEGFPADWKLVFVWLFNGELGVRTFFVISGLLITWLMLRETEKRGSVSLRNFYLRRALRILPVYFVFLAVIAALQFFTPFRQSNGQWIANLTFTTGLFTWGGGGAWTTGHLWSLAVEEQFYIVWPLLFVGLLLARCERLAMGLLALPVLLAPLCRAIGYAKIAPPEWLGVFSKYAFTTNFDALAIGCAAAILFFRHRNSVSRAVSAYPRILVLGAALCVLVPYVLSGLLLAGFFTVPLGSTLQSLGIVVLMLQSIVLPDRGFYAVLNIGFVAWVGTLSYSLYIWQQLFCSKPEWFGWGPVWWMSWPGWLVATLIVSCLSYYLLERPLMSLRAKLR